MRTSREMEKYETGGRMDRRMGERRIRITTQHLQTFTRFLACQQVKVEPKS